MQLDSLSELQLDALREVGSVGAGHAATALSQLVDRMVTVEVPEAEVVRIADIPGLAGGAEQIVGAVFARVWGSVTGGILFLASEETVLSLVDLLHGKPEGTTRILSRGGEALFKHTASILIGAYLAGISRLAQLDVIPSSPSIAFDMAGALIEAVIAEVGADAEDAVLVRTTFVESSSRVEAALLFLPDADSLDVLLEHLGVA
jgi:chemotaxis protein CheC